MKLETRRSWMARALAMCFILLILLGNLWFLHFLTGKPAPMWMSRGFEAIASITILLSISLGIYALILAARGAVRGSEHGAHSDR